jgi:hypothetical protein
MLRLGGRGAAAQRQGVVVGDDPADGGENILHRRLMSLLFSLQASGVLRCVRGVHEFRRSQGF